MISVMGKHTRMEEWEREVVLSASCLTFPFSFAAKVLRLRTENMSKQSFCQTQLYHETIGCIIGENFPAVFV